MRDLCAPLPCSRCCLWLCAQDLARPPGLRKLVRHLILLTMFAIYALTYTLPSLGSFMVEGYYNTTAADHDPSATAPTPLRTLDAWLRSCVC